MLGKSGVIKSSALSKQLAGFLLPQIGGHNKELGIQSCFSRLPDCRGTQGKQSDQTIPDYGMNLTPI